jgi:hypothetical protein
VVRRLASEHEGDNSLVPAVPALGVPALNASRSAWRVEYASNANPDHSMASSTRRFKV